MAGPSGFRQGWGLIYQPRRAELIAALSRTIEMVGLLLASLDRPAGVAAYQKNGAIRNFASLVSPPISFAVTHANNRFHKPIVRFEPQIPIGRPTDPGIAVRPDNAGDRLRGDWEEER